VYGRQIEQSTAQLADYTARNEALLAGSDDPQVVGRLRGDEINVSEEGQLVGIRELEHQLQLRTRVRGRVWRGTGPTAMDQETGIISVAVPQPAPHGIPQNNVIHIFEQGSPTEGRQYLGEFRVVESLEGGIRIEPTFTLDERQLERLQTSSGPWVLHETMPVDEHGLLADLGDEQLRELLPEATLEEYLRHGGERTADDDQWHVAAYDDADQLLGPETAAETDPVFYRYYRPLRDYDFLFQELARDQTLTLADINSVQQDIQQLNLAYQGAQQMQAFRTDEIEKLNFDLSGVTKDRQAIEQHLARLERQVHVAENLLQETIRENAARAQELAELQGTITIFPDMEQPAAVTDLPSAVSVSR
jgi:hypothetical protein